MIIFFLILGPNSCVPSVASVTLRDAERFLIVSNSFPTPKTNIFIPNAWKLRKEFVSLQKMIGNMETKSNYKRRTREEISAWLQQARERKNAWEKQAQLELNSMREEAQRAKESHYFDFAG